MGEFGTTVPWCGGVVRRGIYKEHRSSKQKGAHRRKQTVHNYSKARGDGARGNYTAGMATLQAHSYERLPAGCVLQEATMQGTRE